MVALQIRDVPEDVRKELSERARQQGQSLQAFLLALVKTEARRSQNAAVLAQVAKRSDGIRAQRGETAAEVAAQRHQRVVDLNPAG